MSADGGRSVARVRAELAELREHLREVPPHHGAGTRRTLEERIHALEVELARTAGKGDG